ncbi:MAG TPA: CBS domain-containing protein [Thermodesulfobacteriota bacterium]|nr:CBS domain-containing protein [Thermodesulfobacteriota bacterium]
MSLGNLCRREVVVVNQGTPIKEAVKFMEEKNIGSVIVVGNGKPLGIATDRDILLRVVNKGLDPEKSPVDDVMTKEIVTLKEEMGLFEALEQVKGKGIRRFPIVDARGNLKGIMTLDDIIYLLGKEMADVASIIESPLETTNWRLSIK